MPHSKYCSSYEPHGLLTERESIPTKTKACVPTQCCYGHCSLLFLEDSWVRKSSFLVFKVYKPFLVCRLQEIGGRLNLDQQVQSNHNGLFSIPQRNQTSSHVLPACSLASLHIWWGFLGGSVVKNLPANAGDVGLIPGWVRKIPWSRKWQPTPVFLPGKSHGQRSLMCYSPWGCKKSNMIEHACQTTYLANSYFESQFKFLFLGKLFVIALDQETLLH